MGQVYDGWTFIENGETTPGEFFYKQYKENYIWGKRTYFKPKKHTPILSKKEYLLTSMVALLKIDCENGKVGYSKIGYYVKDELVDTYEAYNSDSPEMEIPFPDSGLEVFLNYYCENIK